MLRLGALGGHQGWLALFRADEAPAGHSREEAPFVPPSFPAATASSLPTEAARPDGSDWESEYAQIVDLGWRTLRRLGVPETHLPDAVQDTLLVLHRRRAEFRQQAAFRTWVYGILVRVAAGYRRGARRAANVFDGNHTVALETTQSQAPSPFEQLEKRAAAKLLRQLLDELPVDLRAPFVLVELEELSIEDAAAALGLPSSTCRSYLRRARRAFDEATARERARRTRLK